MPANIRTSKQNLIEDCDVEAKATALRQKNRTIRSVALDFVLILSYDSVPSKYRRPAVRGLFSCAKDRMREKTCVRKTENKISRKSIFKNEWLPFN